MHSAAFKTENGSSAPVVSSNLIKSEPMSDVATFYAVVQQKTSLNPAQTGCIQWQQHTYVTALPPTFQLHTNMEHNNSNSNGYNNNNSPPTAEQFLFQGGAPPSLSATSPPPPSVAATTPLSNSSEYSMMTSSSASPSPPLPPRMYKPCFVCADKSSGYHYGVSSCEGCKGFFRRSIQKNARYICHRDGNCEITKQTRSRCQHCRLQKCLNVGMLRESVRNHRQRRRGKERKRRDQTRPYLDAFDGNPGLLREIFPDFLPKDLLELIQTITNSHMKTSPSLSQISRFKLDREEFDRMKQKVDIGLWKIFSARSTKCIEKIVEFAKSIPGFLNFNLHDQITLVKCASMDVLVLRLCSRYDVTEDSMTFSDGLTLNRAQMHNCGFGPITATVFDFAKRLLPLEIDETEIGLLSALSIICSDHKDLEEPHRIQDVQDPLIEALRLYSRKRRPQTPLIFPQLLMKLYDLRTISMRGSERVLMVSNEVPRDYMPPLISELLLRNDDRL